MQTCTKNIAFESINQFKEWKLQEERKSKAHFVRNSSIKEYGSVKYMYYYCNRSGHYKSKGNGERSPQSQGTCRSGNTCIAYMKTMEDTLSKSVVVEYCSTHTGHEIKVKYLPILQDIKLKIAGVSINRILDDIRDNCLDGGVGREQLVTRQDILNIKRKLNLHTIQKHSNDLLSVCSWVEEMKQLEYNPILAFKTQGEDGNEDVCHLKREDFFLSIRQKDALLKFGPKVICVDSTHETNMYDFYLILVFVIDDHGEGLPVAWVIVNHEDTVTLEVFFRSIAKRVHDLHPDIFMSDDADQFYSAFSNVFGHTRKLLCCWHIDCSWRKSINEHIRNAQEQIEVYHQLRVGT